MICKKNTKPMLQTANKMFYTKLINKETQKIGKQTATYLKKIKPYRYTDQTDNNFIKEEIY